jgi:hypothetical protein
MNLLYAHNEWMHGRKPIPISLRTDFVSASKCAVVHILRTLLFCANQNDRRLCNGL